jgi:hypothetical protein
MKKLIAKTLTGKEFMHSRSDAYFANKNADRICEALNQAKYKLKEGECWYVYDYDFTQEWYVQQVISLTRTGKIKLSYV